jgi:hypothetical protein
MVIGLQEEVLESVSKVLATKEPLLKRAWETAYGDGLRMQLESNVLSDANNAQIVNNVVACFKELPANSVVRTSLLQHLFQGVPAANVAAMLDIDRRSVFRAREAEAPSPSYYLINLGIPRDCNREAEAYATQWCDSLQIPSGKLRKCFFGLFKSMYAEYFSWCMKERHPFVCPAILERIRRERRIWILKGDIFLVCSPSIFCLFECLFLGPDYAIHSAREEGDC